MIILALLKYFKNIEVLIYIYIKLKIHKQSFLFSVVSFQTLQTYFYQKHHMENLVYQYIYLANLLDQN